MRSHNTLTKLIVSGSTALALVSAAITPAIAQTGGATTSPRDLRQQRRTQVQQVREAQRVNFEQRHEELRKQIQERRDAVRQNFQEIREATRAKAREKREEFRAKAQEIKDERKREVALRADEQLNRLNERWTGHFMNVLGQLTNLLGKVQLRMEKAQANGADTERVNTALTAARNAIGTARTAVEAQAKKSYSVTFTSEEALKQAMRNARQLLHRDLTALRDGAMRNARQAAQNAMQALRDVPRVDEEPEDAANAPSTQ